MDKFIRPSRIAYLFVFVSLLLGIYAFTLYKLQIVDGAKYLEDSVGSVAQTSTVYAARGSILDRNGVLLVSDKPVYNVKLSRAKLLKEDDPNGIVLDVIRAAIDYKVPYTDTFPVTMSGPFSYVVNMSETQSSRLADYLEYFDLAEDISATELIAWMRDHYGISYTMPAEDARLIIGVRYELELRAVISIADYTFAEDVDVDFITYLLEHNSACVSVESNPAREYHTKYAAHLLGNIGRMNSDEYEKYKDKGYSLNSYIGKSGVEAAFEEYLHGTDGVKTVYTDSSGAVTGVTMQSPVKAGNSVYLSIDIALQAAAEDALSARIAAMNAERTEDQEKAEGGAVVVLDVKNGSALALASYPSYDLSTFGRDYAALSADPLNPMVNRATQGTYNPGSTFKMVTALAGLKNDKISYYTTVKDEGIYTAYQDYRPKCWIYPSNHGTLNVVGALENSCNYFFYWLGDQLGADAISETASEFGLAQKTGIEIEEYSGTLATPEFKQEKLNEGWWAADTLITAIGQGHNMFTPIQIADYVATIANGGTLYKTSVLSYITDFDYTDVLLRREPEVKNVIDDPNGYFGILQAGMRAVAATGTASEIFKNYPHPVAAKTGTIQSDTAKMNNGVFVCYAPADDPQIAIAVVVEKGGSGSALASIAKDILDVYFSRTSEAPAAYYDNSLVK